MNIYMDESGTFAVPQVPKSRVSAVAAVVIPESQQDEVFREFTRLKKNWGGDQEFKGSSLDETRVSSVVELLMGTDVLVEFCTIDTGAHAPGAIAAFKKAQGERITASLTPQHYPSLVAEMQQIREDWLRLPDQLAAQLFCMVATCEQVLRFSPLYFSQRLPPELGRFRWRIDAKDIVPTGYEAVLENLLCAFIEAMFTIEPSVQCQDFDYSHFERYSVKVPEVRPDLERGTDYDADVSERATDLRLIMREDFAFEGSATNLGLQIADIMASAIARAMNGNLQKAGWLNLGRLVVQRAGNGQTVRSVMLSPELRRERKHITMRSYHGYVLEQLSKNARPMLL